MIDLSGDDRTIAPDAVGAFAWPPKGTHLAYTSAASDAPAVVIVDLDTGELVTIDGASHFAWRRRAR